MVTRVFLVDATFIVGRERREREKPAHDERASGQVWICCCSCSLFFLLLSFMISYGYFYAITIEGDRN